jgi:hypothetical protein
VFSVCDGRAKVWGQMGTYTGVGADGDKGTAALRGRRKEEGAGRGKDEEE